MFTLTKMAELIVMPFFGKKVSGNNRDTMEKTEIDINKPLSPGDIIEMHFKTTGMVWLTATQIALIEYRVEKRKDFCILSHSLPANNRVIFTVRVLKTNPVLVTAAVIGAIIIGTLAVAWLTLDKVEQVTESPTGKVLAGGALVAAILALLVLIKR